MIVEWKDRRTKSGFFDHAKSLKTHFQNKFLGELQLKFFKYHFRPYLKAWNQVTNENGLKFLNTIFRPYWKAWSQVTNENGFLQNNGLTKI